MQNLSAVSRIHTENHSASVRHVAHYSSHECFRNSDLKLHDRLEQARSCLDDTLLECQRSSDLERYFVGVYFVIRTVVEDSLDVLYFASCQRALLHALEQSLLDCRYVVLRNGSAEELFRELESRLLGWRESDMNVSVLTCAAGLLLVLALYVRIALDGLSVSDLLRNNVYAYAVSVFQLSLDDSQLDVSLSAEQSLMCLCVSFENECRILFHESCEALSHLLVFVLVGSFYCYEQYGVTPDIMTSAKGLGCGVAIGAILATENVASKIARGDHGSTFGGNTFACAVSLSAMRYMIDNDFSAVAKEKGAYLTNALKAIESDKIVEVRGMGMLIGIQLPSDFPAGALMGKLLAHGFVAGTASGNVLRLAPPLVISYEEMDAFVAALKTELE